MHPLDAAPFVVRLLAGAFAGGATWIFAYSVGAFALHVSGIPRTLLGRGAIAAAVGYAILGTLVAAWGLFHGLGVSTGAFVIVILAIEAYDHRRQWHGVPSSIRSTIESVRLLPLLDKCAVAVTAGAVATGVVAAALPAVWWDPIAYHLPIVARAIAQHAFVFDPALTQTGFPLLAEAAALPAYAIAGSAGAAMATLGAGIALALVCGAWADRIAPGSGRLSTALVACSALWLWLAPSFYVDIPFALFAIAALAAIATNEELLGTTIGPAVVAGFLAGASAATKYPGSIVVAVCISAVAWWSPAGRRLRCASFCAAGAAVASLGWYVRSAVATGDPLYPFITAHGSGPAHDFAARYVAMTQSWCGGGTSVGDVLSLPWRLLTNPRAFCGDAGYALDLGVIFALASLALWRRTAYPALVALILTSFWFLTSQQWRFLIPSACVIAILASVGAHEVTGRLKNAAVAILLALCAVGVVVDWLPGPARDASNSVSPAFAYIAGAQTGDQYLSGRLESYDAALWLRSHGRGAPCALLDDVRGYYFGPFSIWLNPYYQAKWSIDWSAPAARRYQPLSRAGIACFVANAHPAYVGRTPTGVDWKTLAGDERSGILRKEYSSNDVTVYELSGSR